MTSEGASLSTHVLDAALGAPAVGLAVELLDGAGAPIGAAVTDADGRISWAGHLAPVALGTGEHTLRFDTGAWFGATGREAFYPAVTVTAVLGPGHTHLALLLSPYSYTTYKGS